MRERTRSIAEECSLLRRPGSLFTEVRGRVILRSQIRDPTSPRSVTPLSERGHLSCPSKYKHLFASCARSLGPVPPRTPSCGTGAKPNFAKREFSAPLCQAALREIICESAIRLLKTTSEMRLLRQRKASLRDLPSSIFLR